MKKLNLRHLLIGEFTVKRFMRSALLIYLALGIYAYFFTDRQIFLPPPSSYTDTSEIIKLPSTPTIQISALYLPNPKATYTILFSHGNAEDLGENQALFAHWRSLGFSIFAYDYRGYGTSQGKPSVSGSLADIKAAYQYMTQTLKIPPHRILVYGRSVGGGPSTDLAAHQPIAGLILESTFTSIFRVVIPFPVFPFDKFPNLRNLKQVHCPVLILHGTEDTTIPFSHGQTLYQAAKHPKFTFWVKGAGHNNLIDIAGQAYGETLKKFATTLSDAAVNPTES